MKTTGIALTIAALAAPLNTAQAATIRVPQDQATIAGAVATASAGDTILISDGTYNEHNILLNKVLTLTSVNGSAVTAVDGQNLGGIFQVGLSGTNLVKISGLTIKRGTVGGGWAGGIRRYSGKLEVRNCVFEQNYCNGGVIDARGGASPTDYSIIEPAKTLIVDCVFRNNNAENFAGVLGVTAIRCLFYNNTGWNNPVVIGASLATNCTAYNNTGGVLSNPWTTGGATASTLVNCILWGNSGYNGQQIDGTEPSTVTYSIIQGGYAGTGNLTSDPLFANVAGEDFHLNAVSPGVNMGDPTIFDADGTRSDMGAYGGVYASGHCSPHPAKATATVVNGFVVGATITDPGRGYTNAPAVLIQGGGGSGATATAVVSDGKVVAINITSAGFGYTSAPQIKIASPPFMPWVEIGVSRVNVTQHVVLGRNYVLESSPDLVTWTPTGPSFTAEDETLVTEFVVEETGRYFRIRQVP